MNHLEFSTVMNVVGIENNDKILPNTYTLKDIRISLGVDDVAVVLGKIPLEVANIIYKKYPNNQYNIRINGVQGDVDPIKYAIDDKYKMERLLAYDSNYGNYMEKSINAKKNLNRRKDENKYIDMYLIDSKEGLVVLLTEIKDYYARKQGLEEREASRFDELMSIINLELLKKLNPYITTYEWMNKDLNFLKTVENDQKEPFRKKIRMALEEFDKTVNPFMDKDVQLDESTNYLKNINISAGECSTEKDGCQIHIQDLQSQNMTSYYRYPNGFAYHLRSSFNKQYLTVVHSYFDNKEIISIDLFGENAKVKLNIRYNFTKDTLLISNEEKIDVTPELKKYIYTKLLEAIEIAKTVTIDNMIANDYQICK